MLKRALTTLDRYIIRKYLSTFLFSILIFSMISMAIDFSDKISSFIEKPCTLKEIVFDYFPGFVLYITGLLLPLYSLIAVIFFTSRMASNAEIISIFNAGVSFGRLLRPYLIAAGIVAAAHLALSHFVIPKANKSRLWFERTYVWTDKKQVKKSNIHFLVAPDVKAYIRSYDDKTNKISEFRLEKFTGHQVESILETEQAIWQADKGKWRFPTHSVRRFNGLDESFTHIKTPIDTAINLLPEDFIFYHNQNEEMTSIELSQAIARDRSRGFANTRQYSIELYRRTADAFTGVILTVIGLAVAGRKVRGGIGLHLAMGIGIGAMFILLSKFSVSFVSSGSAPVSIGMWLPNMVFAVVAIWLVKKAQK